MVAGKGSPDQADARTWAYRDPQGFNSLIELVTEASIAYLDGQARAGADVLQIFDSWAGSLPDDAFEAWVVAPTVRIVKELKARHPLLPIIGFPRGAGANLSRYAAATGVEGIGCDTSVPLVTMRSLAETGVAVQGNLDPLVLAAPRPYIEKKVREVLDEAGPEPGHIFNHGHGILPHLPPENVTFVRELVHELSAR
jgi:uroporphyrinogen decarboxylase